MSFSESLLDPARRTEVVAALANVIETEIDGKSGLGGMALKTAFASAKKAKDGLVPKATDKMLPDVAKALEPFWDAKGNQEFGAYLAANSDAAADALLKVADQNAASGDNGALGKVYKGVRGKAKDHVVAALPRLGQTLTPFVD